MPDTRMINAGSVGAAQVTVTAGGPISAALAMVSADQVTVLGNGTPSDPLRTNDTATAFVAQYVQVDSEISAQLGQPVVALSGVPSTGITRVGPATAGLPTPMPNVVGLVANIRDDGSVTVQNAGLLTLSVSDWHLITGEEVGLKPEFVYYVDTGFDSFGHLTTTVPIGGQVSAIVGVALSATTLLLSTPPVPRVVP